MVVSTDHRTKLFRSLLFCPQGFREERLWLVEFIRPKLESTSRSGLWPRYRAGEAVCGEALKEATCGVGQVAG